MKHGGDLITYRSHYNGELIDFSSNINPLGAPTDLKNLIISNFNDIENYPDIQYRNLKCNVSDYLDCKTENILLGNGAVEIIDNFTMLFKRVITATPSFSEYEIRAKVHGKEVIRVPYKSDFTLDIENIEKILLKGDLIILGNPNNPTGLRIDKDILLKLYEIIVRKGSFLLLDEAFYEFCPIDYDSIQMFKKYNYENIGIIRAATKFFALPGIRLGYGCTSLEMVDKINSISLPWSVNAFANIAGKYIFKDMDYVKKSKEYMERERNYLYKELSELDGLSPYKTQTNYMLIKLLNWDEEYIFNWLLHQGILVRRCKSFIDLPDNHIRIAIKSRENNIRLIEALNKIIERKY